MNTALETVYVITPEGVYLGGFCGCRSTRDVEVVSVVKAPSDILDDAGNPLMVDQEQRTMEPQEYDILPQLPDGSLTIDSPPWHAAAIYRGFAAQDGAAVGGTWDYSAVPA